MKLRQPVLLWVSQHFSFDHSFGRGVAWDKGLKWLYLTCGCISQCLGLNSQTVFTNVTFNISALDVLINVFGLKQFQPALF